MKDGQWPICAGWVLVGLMVCALGGSVFGGGIVKNSDFSGRAPGSATLALDWTMPGGESGWLVTDEDGHSGKDALRYQGAKAQIAAPVTQAVPCEANREYVLSAWLKSDGTLAPLVRIIAGDQSGARVVEVASDGTKTWTFFAKRFNSGNARSLIVQVFASKDATDKATTLPGRADVDDVQIRTADEVAADEKVAGGFQPKAPSENIALGKPYTLFPRPNYGYCTDPEDNRQVTDGNYTVGYFWTQKSTVGWQRAMPVIVTIDLGQVEPIRGVSYNTAAGAAQVDWPASISILVSNDGKKHTAVGELVSTAAVHGVPPEKGYGVHRYWTADLRTHGRYVAFLVAPGGPYHFVDEIEIYKGDREWLGQPLAGEAIEDVKEYFRAGQIRLGVERRLREDIRLVGEAVAKEAQGGEAVDKIKAELEQIRGELAGLPRTYEKSFRAVLPLNSTHEKVFKAQAAYWRSTGAAPITVWISGLWDPLSHLATPPREGKPEVKVVMMQGEHRAGAFNVSNAGGSAIELRMEVKGLPGGVNPAWITVHEVAWTDTKSGIPVAAALPAARRDGAAVVIGVPAGMTRQVWMTFDSARTAAGTHRGEIALSDGAGIRKVPLVVQVAPVMFPERPTLHVGGWDYTDAESMYDIAAQTRDAVIAHLRERHVDSPWATAAVLTPGQYDAEGNMTAEPETTRFDRWVARWPGARQYCVFAAVGETFANSRMGTPLFEKKVGGWIRFWADHAKEQGIEPKQICLLLVDEPTKPEQDEVILAWAKAVKGAKTGVRIWEDPCHQVPAKANQEMMGICDVLCPNRPMFLRAEQSFRDYYVNRRKQGTELAFYSCSGPVRLLDPYAYHRLQAWTAWQCGAKSSFFWAFGDSGGGSSWNEYAARGTAYVPFFLDEVSVTAGKHMEAIRESVADYEYFVMLAERVESAAKAGASGEALDRAKRLISAGADRVCNAEGVNAIEWLEPKDRSLADKVRVEVLEAIVELGRQ